MDQKDKSPDSGWVSIHDKAMFCDAVVDRALTAEGIEFIIHGEGTISGTIDGETFSGSWYWDGPYFCRTAEFRGKNLGLDCETIEINATEMRYTRNRGQGEASIVQIGEKTTT